METVSCHDYRRLVTRWRRVAQASGLSLQVLARNGDYPVYFLQTRPPAAGGLYLSAGIHGDEPASCEGLVTWAEKRLPTLARQGGMPLLIFPCLNPWGLVNNRRSDERGRDLNRLFHRRNLAPIRELARLIGDRRFGLAIHLHEDYDALGNYVYEVTSERTSWGSDLLDHCRSAIATDPRRRIDGRVFKDGVFLRRRTQHIQEHPEALFLYPGHCSRVLTFETPSEFALERRVRAQVLLLEACTRRLLATTRNSMP